MSGRAITFSPRVLIETRKALGDLCQCCEQPRILSPQGYCECCDTFEMFAIAPTLIKVENTVIRNTAYAAEKRKDVR